MDCGRITGGGSLAPVASHSQERHTLNWMSWMRIGTMFFLWLALSAATGYAQTSTAGIAGTVKDSTGAVLPGVTVEASSPVLIEKVRSVITDGTGQYRIV